MNKFLIIIVIMLIAIIAVIVQRDQKTKIVEVPKPEVQIIEPPVLFTPKPILAIMPEPQIILEEKDIGIISDDDLRRFVTRSAVFGRDKVLYFEWYGGDDDTMAGTITSDLETRDKRYIITLNTEGGNSLLHRQVFIVPRNYTYEVEILK